MAYKFVSHHGWEKLSDLQCSDYWKMYLWNSPSSAPPLHDLIISLHVNQPHHHIFGQKSLFPYAKFFKEISPPILLRGRIYYALCSYLFPFLNTSSLSFVVQTMAFQAKLYTHCVLPKSYSVVRKFPELF